MKRIANSIFKLSVNRAFVLSFQNHLFHSLKDGHPFFLIDVDLFFDVLSFPGLDGRFFWGYIKNWSGF